MAFSIRCEMVNEIKGNCKDKYRRKGEKRLCGVRIALVKKLRHRATVLCAPIGRKSDTD